MNVPSMITLVVVLACGGYVLFGRYDDSTRAAERRWRANNRQAKAAGCPCGKPATVVVRDPRVVGGVASETWTCAEHEGASMWSGTAEKMVPSWPRPAPCAGCVGRCGRSGPIGGSTVTWHCPTRPGSEETP